MSVLGWIATGTFGRGELLSPPSQLSIPPCDDQSQLVLPADPKGVLDVHRRLATGHDRHPSAERRKQGFQLLRRC
jgi:hypothetical protein